MEDDRRKCLLCGGFARSTCSRCGAPYCGRDCQTLDWKVHKRDCARMAVAALHRGDPAPWLEEEEEEEESSEASSCESWRPAGSRTFFPEEDAEVSAKTPMGRPIAVFENGRNVDGNFASPDMINRDRIEMAHWLLRTLNAFDGSLGCMAQAVLKDRPAIKPWRRRCKLRAIYLAGVEGTGHHGVLPLLLYPAVRAYGPGVLAWWRSLKEVLLKTPPRRRRRRLAELLSAMDTQDKPHIVIWGDSWPYGEEDRGRWAQGCHDPCGLERERRSGNPGNSVDLQEFVQLFSEYGEVRVLALHRGLVASAYSHKEWDGGLVPHARVLALFLEYLTGVLRDLDPEMWRWLAYEDLCEAHWRGNFEAVAPVAEFLGLPPEQLVRAFRCFSPSRKDAARELPESSRRSVENLERKFRGRWFPRFCPDRRLLADVSLVPERPRPAAEEAAEPLARPGGASWQEAAEPLARPGGASWQATEDHLLDDADIDPSVFTSLHVWIEGRGFGSELNNLLSAAIYCEENDLECVVEDEGWNAGRLHDYLEAEPIIRHASHIAGRTGTMGPTWRPLEIRRSKGVATPGWFAVREHAQTVSFEQKSAYARTVWKYTPTTRDAIEELNAELDLPEEYVAVHLRGGDKVSGPAPEGKRLPTSNYAVAAAAYCVKHSVNSVIICSDDIAAAEELARELAMRSRDVVVRWRRRPLEGSGHQQAGWKALPLRERAARTRELLADVEVMRQAAAVVCTFGSNVGRLVALLREGPTESLDEDWTNT